MTKLFEKLEAINSNTSNPLAIFDLDGTLFDVTHRTDEILKRFIADEKIRSEYPSYVEKIKSMKHSDHKYSLEQTLNVLGIDRYSEHAARFLFLAEKFWFQHFFRDDLLAFDRPFQGALPLVQWMHDQKIKIVYLSGRDVPNMGRGTLASLEEYGFPVRSSQVSVILKPSYGMDDLVFKTEALSLIQHHGQVIATFDNEPANVELFSNKFPEAMNIHFHSHFARAIELNHPSVSVINSFREIGF